VSTEEAAYRCIVSRFTSDTSNDTLVDLHEGLVRMIECSSVVVFE